MTDGERTTIKELARRSGVSVGTVSRALNGYADVSAATRARILELAKELEYTPAAAARTLATRRSHVVGVFLETGAGHPDLQHPFFHEVLVGLRDALGEAGYDLLLFAGQPAAGGFGDASLLNRCRHRNVDAAVVMGVEPDDPELRRLARSSVPCVGVDLALQAPGTAQVASDNVRGGRLATEHLIGLGHRRIATICGPPETRPGLERLRGYRDALADAGIGYRDEYVQRGDFYVESGRLATQRLLELEDRPTAVFVAGDLMAAGAMQAAADRGLEVPADLSVVGFDDILHAAHLGPGLTTVRQDKKGLGVAAARAVLAVIADPEASPSVVLDVDLVERGSAVRVTNDGGE